MATSLRIDPNVLFALFGLLSTEQALAAPCDRINSTFSIVHWQGEIPRSVVLHVLKGTSGEKQETAAPIRLKPELSESEGNVPGLVLTLTPDLPTAPRFLAADDYRLVIDGKREFVIHDIVMTDRAALGCPMQSAMVNECKLGRDGFLNFDASCGRPAASTAR